MKGDEGVERSGGEGAEDWLDLHTSAVWTAIPSGRLRPARAG